MYRNTGRILTKDEEYELFKKYKEENNIESRDIIILSNIGLCKNTVKKYSKFLTSLTFEDLLQQCMIEMIDIIDKFDYERGYKFSTYLVTAIDRKISRYIMTHDRTIRIPVHISSNYNKIIKKANSMQMTSDEIKSSDYELFKDTGLSKKEFVAANSIYKQVYSLDVSPVTKSFDDNSEPFFRLMPDKDYNLEEKVFNIEFIDTLNMAINDLDVIEQVQLLDIFVNYNTYADYIRANGLTKYEFKKQLSSIVNKLKSNAGLISYI